jgi:acyl-coenzyme A synthetase/AMP-(fatty) acid ligase
MSFVDMFMYYGRTNPEKQAIILADRVVTFGMLASGIRSVAAEIEASGLNRTHTVAVRVESPSRHIIVVSALYRLGIVSLSASGSGDLSQPGVTIDAIISDEDKVFPGYGRTLFLQDHWFMRQADPHAPAPARFADDELARIIMSSGTTATPKAIGHTARVVEDRIITGRRTLSYAPWDRMMCLPPLSSSLGFGSALHALAYGHSVVVADSAIEALQMIALYNVDLVVANPQHLRGMVEAHTGTPIPTPSLRMIKYGGNALVPSLAMEVRQRFCKDLLCVYSSTESGPIAFGHYDHILANPGSTGIVAPWVDLEILGSDDKQAPVGVEGRLRVRSQWQGYNLADGPGAAHEWMYTGDLAKVSADNTLTLIGRSADAMRIDGAFVSPEQIEQALFGFPGIADVAAVGMKQAVGNDQIWLAVVTDGALDKSALSQFLVEKNPLWRAAKIVLVAKFKRNEMGKIVRSRVREILLSQQPGLKL